MIVICQGCKRPWGIEDCREISIAGPSHKICPICFADVTPEHAVPPVAPVQPESTIEQRVRQAQGGKS